ncbi:MAG: hypothetical protein II347_03090, partial [Lachnospiraceae bacterium]|nr:hypothetical protein [Lachnospiraceae bacterium]
MAGKIQLTPAELLAQSQEMLSLQKEFESLFGQTNTLLTQVNQNWSANLANNFVGKLTSAQKGFANVIALLEQGGNMAATSAKTFESMDSLLSKVMNGDSFLGTIGGGIAGVAGTIGGIAGVAGGVTGFGGIAAAGGGVANVLKDMDWGKVGSTLSDFGEYAWNQLKQDWQGAGETMEWLGEQYNKLPAEVRKKIEKTLGGTMTTSISVTYDIITGNVTWDTAYDVIDEVWGKTSTGAAIKGVINEVFENGALERQSYYDQLFFDQMDQGHILTGITSQLGAFTDTILIGSIDILGDIGTGILQDLPLVGLVEDAIGIDIAEGWNGLMDAAHDGMNHLITEGAEAMGQLEEMAQEFVVDVYETGKEVVSDVIDAGKEV